MINIYNMQLFALLAEARFKLNYIVPPPQKKNKYKLFDFATTQPKKKSKIFIYLIVVFSCCSFQRGSI